MYLRSQEWMVENSCKNEDLQHIYITQKTLWSVRIEREGGGVK